MNSQETLTVSDKSNVICLSSSSHLNKRKRSQCTILTDKLHLAALEFCLSYTIYRSYQNMIENGKIEDIAVFIVSSGTLLYSYADYFYKRVQDYAVCPQDDSDAEYVDVDREDEEEPQEDPDAHSVYVNVGGDDGNVSQVEEELKEPLLP